MADYFPVLSRAVAGLPNNTAEARRAVYDRARAAIVRQLRAIEPPLAEEDIAKERLGLEEAIRKIEANLGSPKPAASAPAPAQTPPPAAAAPQRPSEASDRTVVVPPSGGPVGEAPRIRPGGAPDAGRPAVATPSAQDRPAPAQGRPAQPRAAQQERGAQGRSPQAGPATRSDGRPIVRTAPSDAEPAQKKRSGLAIALGALAVIAVGAGVFAARGPIAAMFGGAKTEVANTTPASPPETAPTEQPASPPADKSADRAPQSDAPPAAPEPAPQAQPPEQEVARAPEPTAPTEAPPAPAEPQQAATSGALVAQRAVLYEEGPNQQSGEALNGTVLWRTESVSGGQNQPLETALRGDVDIPGRKLGATITIRRNLDTTLPASHTIEIQFKIPENFSNAGVSNVPGLLMKADEAARGAAVAGLSVRVMNGFFLIGLSNLDTEKSVNEQLLRDRGWIDVPILYENGRRAVLTLEKGTPGAQAFNDAFNAWRGSSSAANQPASGAPR